MTWNNAIDAYSEHLKDRPKPTRKCYISDAKQFSEFTDKQLNRIKEEDVKEFLGSLDVSHNTKFRKLTSLRGFFDMLVEKGAIKENPLKDYYFQPIESKKKHPTLTREEVDRMKDKSANFMKHRNRAFVELLYSCGLKPQEIIQLKLSNLYLDLGYLRIVGKNERIVPMSKQVIKEINDYIKMERGISEKDALFISKNGTKLFNSSAIWAQVKRLAKKAEIKKNITDNMLRASFAKNLSDEGVDVKYIQKLLGMGDQRKTEKLIGANEIDLSKLHVDLKQLTKNV